MASGLFQDIDSHEAAHGTHCWPWLDHKPCLLINGQASPVLVSESLNAGRLGCGQLIIESLTP